MAASGNPLDRQLIPKSIQKFRGISQYRSIVTSPMEHAQDTLNVIVSGAGHLEKLRVPLLRATGSLYGNIIDTLYDFQQGNGTRQMFANWATGGLGFYTDPGNGGALILTQLEEKGIGGPRVSWVDSNNLLFLANGQRMVKWDGTSLWNWGIAPPVGPPTLGITAPITSISRNVGGFLNVTFNPAALGVGGNFDPRQLITSLIGMTVQISGVVGDPSNASNGFFPVLATSGGYSFIISPNPGIAYGPLAQGTVTIFAGPAGGITDFTITQVARLNGITTLSFANNFRIQPGEEGTVAGVTDFLEMNGTWTIAAATSGSVSFVQPGPDIAPTTPGPGTPTIVGGFTDIVGPRLWRYSYKRSITGHESPASPPSTWIPLNNGLVSNIRAFLQAAPPTDLQVDTICWYGTLDSGSTWYLISEVPLSQGLNFSDGFADALLDTTQEANYINYPPPVGALVSKWQGRIYVAVGQTLFYSGFEKILRGRPEESFPPYNGILLQFGANPIRAFAPLMNGVVIWDNNNRLFMFKGTVEDIVTNQPVSFSEQLEEMPWQIGAMSHYACQSTPYGVIWLGSDKAVHKWNGIFYGEIIGPTDISQNIFPLLQRITPGTEPSIQSAYFNFLERDWYVLLVAVDGSQRPNRIIFFDVSKEDSDNLGVFVSDIQADAIAVHQAPDGSRHLFITSNNSVYEIKANTTATGGIHQTITSTTQELRAYWVSCYDGNDSPTVMKMYRWGRIVTDQSGYGVLVTLVDDNNSPLARPTRFKNFKKLVNGNFSVNWKAKRASVTINFPVQDVDTSVLELDFTHIPCSER